MELIQQFGMNFLAMFIDMSFYIMLGLFFVGILNTYIKKERILKHLGRDSFSSVVKASAVGVPLPLCSCGVVPTAVELKKGGASNGAVISFLISTPQTGIDSILATYALMGWGMALFRAVAAFLSGIIGGALVNLFAKHDKMMESAPIPTCGCGHEESPVVEASHCCCHEETPVVEASPCCCHAETPVVETAHCCCGHEEAPVVEETHSCCSHATTSATTTKPLSRPLRALRYAYIDFLDEIALHFLVGMVLATMISTFLPADFFLRLGLNDGILAMIAMVIIGLPMYICSTSSIPIALSLLTRGLSMGGAFVFLFTGPVTNIASLLVLSKSLGKKITGIYIAIVVGCSIGFGLLLDVLVAEFEFLLPPVSGGMHAMTPSALHIVVAVAFAALLVRSLAKRIMK